MGFTLPIAVACEGLGQLSGSHTLGDWLTGALPPLCCPGEVPGPKLLSATASESAGLAFPATEGDKGQVWGRSSPYPISPSTGYFLRQVPYRAQTGLELNVYLKMTTVLGL